MYSTAWKIAVRRSMLVIGLAGGFTVLGAGIAASTATADEAVPVVGPATAGSSATDDDDDETSGKDGVGSGNQAEAEVDAPVDASDNQVTVIGDGNQSSGGRSEPKNGVDPDADADHTSGEDGVLSGNQVEAEAEAPVQLTGNQLTVIGDDNTSGGSTSETCPNEGTEPGDTTNGDDGILSGNQVDADVDAPVDASGNQVTVVGDENVNEGSRTNDCRGSDGAADGGQQDGSDASDGGEGGDVTSGEDGFGSGNQLTLSPALPVDASGNQLTVIGDGNQSGGSADGGQQDGSDASDGGEGGDVTSGEDGAGSGNQLAVDPVARVDADRNQVTVVGNDNQSGGPEDGDDATSGSGDPADEGDAGNGDDRGEQVRGGGAGGPGNPGATALGAFPADTAPATAALPQTGAAHGPGLGLLGLVMVLAGLVLAARRREVVDV